LSTVCMLHLFTDAFCYSVEVAHLSGQSIQAKSKMSVVLSLVKVSGVRFSPTEDDIRKATASLSAEATFDCVDHETKQSYDSLIMKCSDGGS
jgi:hypothetical protein